MSARCSPPERGIFAVGWNLATSLNAPGALYICDEQLIIRAMFQEWRFARDQIVAISAFRILFWRVLRIDHSVHDYARYIGFRPYYFDETSERLARAGFRIDTPKA